MFKITKKFTFEASHQLCGLPKDHPCTHIHGHSYGVTVELKSEVPNAVGFVVDYRELEPIKNYIDGALDHRHLNDLFLFNPTAEHIAEHLFNMFKPIFPMLCAVEVSETPKTTARYEPTESK